MEYEWDQNKADTNVQLHKVDFDQVYDLDWDTVIEFEDIREDYNEVRMIAYGLIDVRLHCLVYTMRGDNCRVISLRKANKKEEKLWQNAK